MMTNTQRALHRMGKTLNECPLRMRWLCCEN